MRKSKKIKNPLLAARRKYSQKCRAKRAEMYRRFFPDIANHNLLDLGGGKGDHIAMVVPNHQSVTIADYHTQHLGIAHEKHGFQTLTLDGAARLPIHDNQYDIVFCNSVIEHVTGPKDKAVKMKSKAKFEQMARVHQKQFADQIRRIGRGYFVQTPYKWFPIESHTITPSFVQLLPRPVQLLAYRMVPKKQTLPDFNLLNIEDMKELFPDAYLVYEKSLGLVKSIIAVKLPKT
jgi:ubiquinone/menaquinone biosynthesis C-methylase UbiE